MRRCIGEVGIDHVCVTPDDMPVYFLDGIHRPATGAIAISRALELGLEDWFQHDLGGGLNRPISDGWNAERTLAIVIRFRDHHPPHRNRPVRLRNQFLAQACQPRIQDRRISRRVSMANGLARRQLPVTGTAIRAAMFSSSPPASVSVSISGRASSASASLSHGS